MKKIMHVTYDEYIYPELIKIIDGILAGNVASLYELFNYDPDFKYEEILSQMKTLEQEISEMDNYSKEKVEKLKLLQQLNELKNESKSHPEEDDYHQEVLDSIDDEYIKSIKITDLISSIEFLESTQIVENLKDPVLKRILKKEKK